MGTTVILTNLSTVLISFQGHLGAWSTDQWHSIGVIMFVAGHVMSWIFSLIISVFNIRVQWCHSFMPFVIFSIIWDNDNGHCMVFIGFLFLVNNMFWFNFFVLRDSLWVALYLILPFKFKLVNFNFHTYFLLQVFLISA